MLAPPFDFNTTWDEAIFLHGPASIFSLDHKGWLKVDPERTRDVWLILGPLPRQEAGHYVLQDKITGLKTYICVTNAELAAHIPRALLTPYPTAQEAWAIVQAQWIPVPVPVDTTDL